MFEEILFPTDGSEGATAGLPFALDVAAAHGATLHLLGVANTTRGAIGVEAPDTTLVDEARDAVEAASEGASERGVPTVETVERGGPHRVICEYAADAGVDVVLMPTHGRRGLERFLLGSTTERVVRRCEVPVLTFRPVGDDHDEADAPRFAYPFEDVLVATDGSDCARDAVERAVALTKQEGAALHVLSVVDVSVVGVDVRSSSLREDLETEARGVVDDAAAVASAAGVDPVAAVVEFGSSASAVVRDYARANDVDMIVVGTHGRTGFDRYVLGSVAEFLVRTSPVPVLTVRASTEGA